MARSKKAKDKLEKVLSAKATDNDPENRIVRVRGGPKGFRMLKLKNWKTEKAQGRGRQR